MTFTGTLTALGQFTVEPEPIRRRLRNVGIHVSDVLRACERLERAPVPDLPGGQLSQAWRAAVEHLGHVAGSHGHAAQGTVESIGRYLDAVATEDQVTGDQLAGTQFTGSQLTENQLTGTQFNRDQQGMR